MKIFISSTFVDLEAHRRAVRDVILRLGHQPVGMEYFGARPAEPQNAALGEIEKCNILIGIYAHRFGWVPEGDPRSITEQEFDLARGHGIPCFCYRVQKDFPWDNAFKDTGAKAEALERFLVKIDSQLLRAEFTTPEDLASKVAADLGRELVKRPPTEPPFMVDNLPPDFVSRPEEFDAIIRQLLDPTRSGDVALTAALRGAGGYGKTTLAKAICHHLKGRGVFPDGVLWVTLGDKPPDAVGVIVDWLKALTGDEYRFTGIDAAKSTLARTLEPRKCLLVVDDVWNRAHLEPFLVGGMHCARLVTTRNADTLPHDAHQINVDAMKTGEAVALLRADLPAATGFEPLAQRLGEWPLLLKLANGVLRTRVQNHQPLEQALAWMNQALDKRGLVAFDARDAAARDQAVSRTLGVSLQLLSTEERARYGELAVFPEDAVIPFAAMEKLWGAVAGMEEFDTEELCERLGNLSLLLDVDLGARTIQLHDVIRSYLVREQGAQLYKLHGQFMDAYHINEWADLDLAEPYLWDHLAHHLLQAQRGNELVTTVQDLRYLVTKTKIRNTFAVEMDLIAALKYSPDDNRLRLLVRNFINMEHLLARCATWGDVAATLLARLQHLPELAELCQALEPTIPRPYVAPWHRLPDLPHAALIRTLAGHTNDAKGCAFSPSGDTIVSASFDGTLKLWDAHTGQERLTLKGHTDWVNGCAFSPTGDTILSASKDHTLKLWDTHTGQERLTLIGHTDAVIGCAFSPSGDTLVSASWDNTLKLWDAHTGQERFTLTGHTNVVFSCAFSPSGDTVVSASWDHTLKLWDAHTGQERLTFKGHTNDVYGCAFSPSGNTIVSASFDGTLKLWDTHTGQERLTLAGHAGPVTSCAFSPAGDTILSTSSDNTLKLWDTHTGQERLTLTGHTSVVNGCAFSPSGDTILSASSDNTLKLWDAYTGQERFTLKGHTDWVDDCAFSPSGDTVVSASWDHTLKLWDTHTGQERLTLTGHTDWVFDCAFSPTGDIIVSASKDNTLKLWDAHTGQERLSLTGHTDWVQSCAFSPSGDTILSASSDNTLKLWDAYTGQERFTLKGHTARVFGCAFSPAGDTVVSASRDHTLKLWDTHTGQERFTLTGHTDWVNGCVFSPMGDTLVSASKDNTLKLWDAHTGQERLTLTGHTDWVQSCVFSPTGDTILSTSTDKTLKLWDAYTGQCMVTSPLNGFLRGCAFHPDGEHIIVASSGGLLFLRLVK